MAADQPFSSLPPSAENEMRCYRAGDSIAWWLHETTGDSCVQQKKDAILSRLAELICDPLVGQVFTDIGDHPDTPLKLLIVLAEDGNADLRFALAENHNIHSNVLCVLAEDANPFVADRAQRTLARLGHSATLAPEVDD